MATEPSRGARTPREYRPDIRPMLILGVLLVLVVFGWIALSARILPAPIPIGDIDRDPLGLYTRTPDAPTATTLHLQNGTYILSGSLPHTGSGTVARERGELHFSADAACGAATGRYSATLGRQDRYGLLPENTAETLDLVLIEDACASRAETLDELWVLRRSLGGGVYGICDPPNEEAAITGHWPEPSGC